MKWSDFFAKRFGINLEDEMDTAPEQGNNTQQPPVENNKPDTLTIPQPENNSRIAELEKLLEEERLKSKGLQEANDKLVSGMSIENSGNKTVEENIYSLFGKKED